MAVKIAHSSSDENGRISGGKAGDQTGREARIQNWYANKWHYVIRFLKPEMREKFAAAMEAIANNNNIGYAQDDRNTLLKEAEKVGWDISKIKTPCECDCSSAVTVACICAGVPKTALYISGNCATTRNLRVRLKNTGLVEVTNDAKFVGSDKYALRGDIYLKEGVHVVAAISNGSNAQATESKGDAAIREWQLAAIADGFKFPKYGADGEWGKECESVANSAVVKKRSVYRYPNLTKLVQRVVGADVDGKCGLQTSTAIKKYQKAHGLVADGSVGPLTWRVILGVK